FAMRAGRAFKRLRRRTSRLPQALKIAVAASVLFAAWNAVMTTGVAPVAQQGEPALQASGSAASKINASQPAPKPTGKGASSALPSFIEPAAAEAVERAIAAAQDTEIYVSWQSGTQHGLVILRSDNGDGCRQYQISRHDLPETRSETVRRCSSDRR